MKVFSPKQRALYIFAVKLFTLCTVRIAVPVVLFTLFARWIVEKFDLGWWPFGVAFLCAGLFTSWDLKNKTKEWGSEYTQILKS